jgi:hypothetical protein
MRNDGLAAKTRQTIDIHFEAAEIPSVAIVYL